MTVGKNQDLRLKKLYNLYLQRYASQDYKILEEPEPNTRLIVIIPCYKEPHILNSLLSLYNCEPPNCEVEIICVVNHSENEESDIKEYNRNTIKSINSWIKRHPKSGFTFFVIKAFDLPKKHAGVGLARKIGMDEAVRRFDFLNIKDGIIVCFDADCECNTNYLSEINKFYQKYPKTNGAIIYFEHPLNGDFHSAIYHGITNYELHLRYYKNALKYINHPSCYHSIGSCITVSSEAYQKQGGMNKRKAGEDFYFIQKIIALGNVKNINSTTVYPSSRPSDRVPFGTGKAIEKILQIGKKDYYTYNPRAFEDLKLLFEKVSKLYEANDLKSIIEGLPESIQAYLIKINFYDIISKIKNNSGSERQFIKSFYHWFNGFIVLKYIHFSRDDFYNEVEIQEAANWIINKFTSQKFITQNKKMILVQLRNMDRSQ